MKVNRLKRDSEEFPEALAQIPSPPKNIYFTGAAPSTWLNKPRVAIVGSRKVSAYGREVTDKLAGELAGHGIVVISGLAFGVDSIAHKAALAAGGVTVAVLPTSLDNIYPVSHQGLARQIAGSEGTLISEYPPGAVAYKQNFIARNRLVSGLADALLITEAAINSGSLHTANFALEQGKTVMAVPGNIFTANSQGTNNLIKSGALPVTSCDDVLFALGLDATKTRLRAFHGPASERQVLDLIATGVSSQEDIAAQLGLSGAELGRILTALELNGHIKPTGGGFWIAK